MLNYEGQNELTQCFARVLFSSFPDWERFAKVVNNGSIEVNVEQEGPDHLLHLCTADDEITIGFEGWHTHVGPFLGLDIAESVATAMRIIQDFVSEKTVVKVAYRDGKWIGASLEYLAAPSEPAPHSTTRVFSWRRTYDGHIENP